MSLKTLSRLLAMSIQAAPKPVTISPALTISPNQLHAMIYRGKQASEGCPESVGELLNSTYPNIQLTYAGPDEAVQINAETLGRVDIFAQPGGPDLDEAWIEAKEYASAVRDFVANGGRYLGFCLGAYLAGHDPGFGLLSQNGNATQEIEEPGSQVENEDDTIIQIDWRFSTGPKKGKTELKRWMYFQDGPALTLTANSSAIVLGRYSSNGDVAALLSSFGKGWVGCVGPHPEANQKWYDDEEIQNPDGIHFDIGHDFVRAAMGVPNE